MRPSRPKPFNPRPPTPPPKPMNELKLHPFCLAFPEATAEERLTIKNSINTRGQHEPIVLFGGEILDGRTRYHACRELKIPPQFRQFDPVKDGPDPLQWVIDRNLNRRHLTVGQRAALGVSLTKLAAEHAAAEKEKNASQATTPVGPPADNDEDLPEFLTKPAAPETAGKPLTQEQAAAAMGVSPKSVGAAANLAKNDPERFQAVKDGKTSLHAAVEESKADAAKQDQGILGKQTGTIPNQYRTECADMLAASHGDKFAEAIRTDTILKDGELRTFMKLPIQDQKQIAAMVARGWKTREAVKFAKGIFEKDDPIRDLINLAIMRDGRAATKLDGHTILILSDAVLTETKGEFVLPFVAATLEAQAKPETETAPVENTLGKAIEGAKPAKKSVAPASSGKDAASHAATATPPQKSADSTKLAGKAGKSDKEKAAAKAGIREAFLVSVEHAPKNKRTKMLLDYWKENGDEAVTFLMEYPNLTTKPDKTIVATLEEIAASIKQAEKPNRGAGHQDPVD